MSAPAHNAALEAMWLSAPHGRLCPWQQARALALREASRELHSGRTQLEWVAARVVKMGGGHPGQDALHKFFKLVDADPKWFPGKQREGKKRGRPPLLTPAKRRCIATSAMAAKHGRNDEPCVAAVVHTCPRATLNPVTNQPFCDKTIRKVFATECFDVDPEYNWRYQLSLPKVCLPDKVKLHRVAMASTLLEQKPQPSWWMRNVVWFDPLLLHIARLSSSVQQDAASFQAEREVDLRRCEELLAKLEGTGHCAQADWLGR